ncbi:Transglutaminase-like enzyme, putative cysteine protease [Catalinimonas alkaloidigena]|uniref:Transglutaminase-like enzyme, putative cysteine protease n=1 Tax=Catalinimonas alkaloidigena TaxID=1075417 RepID=A0A1G9GC32_9BACT|nr:transglutaminase family protein [Catalinimonas alkaloidigena]SDK98111.1 Transglutaminase-like enzyme, putative cysteine protease [Catalinimonas alkaloidigena]
MKYELTHKTIYRYHAKTSTCQSRAWLIPKVLETQQPEEIEIEITPTPRELIYADDFFGNKTFYFALNTPHHEMTVTVRSLIDKQPADTEAQLFDDAYSWEEARERIYQHESYGLDLCPFILPSPFVRWNADMAAYAAQVFRKDRSLFDATRALVARIFKDFKFVSGATTLHTPVETVFKERKGVCQDFSHLAIACLRSLGLPARYVSGYLETLPPPGKKKLQGADASHAWISVYMPDRGWVDFDPTNNLIPNERHLVLAWGRDYGDVTPIKGIFQSSGKQTLKVEVDVIPLKESAHFDAHGRAEPT